MTLAHVTLAGVLASVAEFDLPGREAFLRSTGFGRARTYFLELDGHLYDSKAIVGYAHGISTGTPLAPDDFSGGDKTVAQRLRGLGFTVRYLPVLDWTRDEITLACALVEAKDWKQLYASDASVHAFSELLQSPAIHPLDRRYPYFRNPAGVAQKTRNIASVHPAYRGAGSNGNRPDKEVLDDFLANPAGMRAMAARIRVLLTGGEALGTLPDPDTDDAAMEGGLALRAHLRREPDPNLRRKKLTDTKRRGLLIACEACTFDFGQTYGSHGLDYIECHHRIPLHVTGETKTRLADLALLCSNCHRMIRRTRQWLTVDKLKHILTEQQMTRPGGVAVNAQTPGGGASLCR